MSLSLLDKSIAAIRRAIPGLPAGELERLKDAEEKGKTRKGAIEAIEEALAEIEAGAGEVVVENIIPGSDVSLHDGRHLLFGERAAVPLALADFMRERGQVK